MCFFPSPVTPLAKSKGVDFFTCGTCPECLRRKASYWSLRACAEAKYSPAYMITLTYDNYKRDSRGHIIGEYPPDSSLRVSKRDCQLFFKRLRRAFPSFDIKYICTAEYGSRTHRAHYHVLLFGIVLTDLIYKGRSKRGNIIRRSPTLSRIWANAPKDADWRTLPIVTVDACMVGSAVARYCTKYCSKDTGRSGGDDTFMLCSRGIGERYLLEKFNGLYYLVDGVQYPIPRVIWQRVISAKYGCSFRYVRPCDDFYVKLPQSRNLSGQFMRCEIILFNRLTRSFALLCRDSDPDYQRYREYWKSRIDTFELTRPSIRERIVLLPDDKYRIYKARCAEYFSRFDSSFRLYPRMNETRKKHEIFKYLNGGSKFIMSSVFAACHLTTDDTAEILRLRDEERKRVLRERGRLIGENVRVDPEFFELGKCPFPIFFSKKMS